MALNAEATSRSRQSLSGTPNRGETGAIEFCYSPSRSIALIAILLLACILVAAPVIVAGISMVDPGSLELAQAWVKGLSPSLPDIDFARTFMALVSVILVLKAGRGSGSLEYHLEAD